MAHKVAIINGKAPSGGSGGVTDADLSNAFVNFFTKGVVSPNHYKVEQQGTPNMTVKVNTGKAYVPNSAGTMMYATELDAIDNVTITANASGNPRIDAVVIKIDLAATPNSTASNVASLVAVPGTPAASPSAPNDAAVQSSIGGGNAFLRLANVTVANAAASITTANIADVRVQVTEKPVPANLKTNTDGATVTFDLAESSTHFVTLGGNRTLALSNVSVGQYFVVRLTQDGTGSRTVTWFTTIKWPDNTPPTLTPTAGKTDTFGFLCTASGSYDGYIVGQNL